jgi:hypothetical protein
MSLPVREEIDARNVTPEPGPGLRVPKPAETLG